MSPRQAQASATSTPNTHPLTPSTLSLHAAQTTPTLPVNPRTNDNHDSMITNYIPKNEASHTESQFDDRNFSSAEWHIARENLPYRPHRRDSMSYMEANRLDGDVPAHLVYLVPVEYMYVWECVTNGVRRVAAWGRA